MDLGTASTSEMSLYLETLKSYYQTQCCLACSCVETSGESCDSLANHLIVSGMKRLLAIVLWTFP